MERELASLKTDVEYVKKGISDIQTGVEEIIERTTKMLVDVESLRGRIREAEHDIISLKKDIEKLREDNQKAIENISTDTKRTQTIIYKYGIILVMISSGATVGIEKLVKLIFM